MQVNEKLHKLTSRHARKSFSGDQRNLYACIMLCIATFVWGIAAPPIKLSGHTLPFPHSLCQCP